MGGPIHLQKAMFPFLKANIWQALVKSGGKEQRDVYFGKGH